MFCPCPTKSKNFCASPSGRLLSSNVFGNPKISWQISWQILGLPKISWQISKISWQLFATKRLKPGIGQNPPPTNFPLESGRKVPKFFACNGRKVLKFSACRGLKRFSKLPADKGRMTHKFSAWVRQKSAKISRMWWAEKTQNFPHAAGTKDAKFCVCGG